MIKINNLFKGLLMAALSVCTFNVQAQCNNFVNHFNNSGDEEVVDAKEHEGSYYVLGTFTDELSLGSNSFSTFGSDDIFVSKLNVDGDVVWAKQLGGVLSDGAAALDVDESGNVYIIGNFKGTLTANGLSVISEGNDDMFIAKYSPSGTILWLEREGTTDEEIAKDIVVTSNGVYYLTNDNIYIGKRTLNGEFSTSSTETSTISPFTHDIEYNAIDANSNGDIYVSGRTLGYNFDTDQNENTIFYIKKSGLDLSDISAVFGIAFGFSNSAEQLYIDSDDNIYLSGYFEDQITLGSTVLNSIGCTDVFISKFNSNGSLVYIKSGGSGSCDDLKAMLVNSENNHVYLELNFGAKSFDGVTLSSDNFSNSKWVELNELGQVVSDQAIANNPLSNGFILVNSVTNDFMLIGEAYSISVKGKNFNSFNEEDIFSVGFTDFDYFKNLEAPEFCTSIIDPSTGKNQLIWDSNQESGFANYRIYKSNLFTDYEEVYEQVSGGSGVYTDLDSDPIKKAEYYEIRGVDICGDEFGENSYRSDLKTSHLILYKGPNGLWSLSWDYYEIGSNNSYYYRILRGATEETMEPYDSVSQDIETWTDTDGLDGSAFYKVEIILDNKCDLTAANPSTNRVSVEDGNVGLLDLDENAVLEVFPNPTSGDVQLVAEMDYSVLDAYGKVVLESTGATIDLSAMQSGLYIVKTANGNANIIKE